MAARIDFTYFRERAVADDDLETLDLIEADRDVLLSGGRLPEPGEYLSLTLALAPAGRELRDSDGPGPGPRSFPGPRTRPGPQSREAEPLRLVLRRDLAAASLDTLLEIFRDEAHARLPGFRGEDGGTVFDLGANEGYYTLRMKRLNPAVRIVAVEPVWENVDLLQRNMAANGLTEVEAVHAAVSATVGEMTIETYPHVGTVASNDIGAFPRPWIRDERIRRRRVPAVTLSGLLDRAAVDHAQLLKVDIEGSEVDVLSGDPAGLQRFERIVVECHGEEARMRCIDIVTSEGFEAVHIEQKRSGDVYFEAP